MCGFAGLLALRHGGRFGLLSLLLCAAVSACASPRALQPVARQNAENLATLAQNVQSALALYERLFAAGAESLIALRIGEVHRGLIAVAGRSTANPPAEGTTWEDLFQNKPPYVHQRGEIVNVQAQGADEARLWDLRHRHGWVYLAVADPAFTPQRAHRLVQELAALQRKYPGAGQRADYLREAEATVITFDPTLAFYREQIEAAKRIWGGLRAAIGRQMTFAETHSRAILAFAQAEVDAGRAVAGVLSDEEIRRALEELGRKHIKDDKLRDAALKLLAGLPGLLGPSE